MSMGDIGPEVYNVITVHNIIICVHPLCCGANGVSCKNFIFVFMCSFEKITKILVSKNLSYTVICLI